MKATIFLILLFFYATIQTYSQLDNFTIRRISPPGGYSFQAIHTIKQDNYGYIWMGTFDGIIRYDSKETIRFLHDYEKTDGLPSNKITGIDIDKKNNVWVSTDKGLCIFNPTQQQFEHVIYDYENGEVPNSFIKRISLDKYGILWIVDSNYFGYLDKEHNQMIRISTNPNVIPSILYRDKTDRLWCGTNDGSIYLVIPEEKKIVKKLNGLGSDCMTIFVDNDEILVGYQNHGVLLYDIDGNLKLKYVGAADNKFKLESCNVRKVLKDSKHRIWVAAYQGLFLANGSELKRIDPNEYPGLPHNSIFEIFEDNQDGIWFGTWSGGVGYLHHSANKFNNFRNSQEPNSLSNNVVSSFTQRNNTSIYVGTEVGGLNKFDLTSKKFQQIEISDTRKIINIKSLCIDKYGGLWVGTAFGGLWYQARETSKFKHFFEGPADGKHISSQGVFSLYSTDSGIWIGTNGGGLNFYNFKTKTITITSKETPFSRFKNQAIRSITIDSKDNLWVGTLDGLNRVNLPTGELTSFEPTTPPQNRINSTIFYVVKEMSNGEIWIGTKGDGINIYNQETKQISALDTTGLLHKKNIYGIIEGLKDDVWITSNDGLFLYNLTDKKLRQFNISDGIPSNLFVPQSIFKDDKGNLYFGGTNGFTQISSTEIQLNNRPPNIFITKIALKNRTFHPQRKGEYSFNEVELQPNETTLKFYFAADNFLLSEKNQFKYRLTNYSNGWVHSTPDASATFINVPAGKYIFEVKASNNDGVWNEIPTQIPIKIKQYWYKSYIAIGLYILLIISIAILVLLFYLDRLKLRKTILIEKVEHELDEQLHEMKLKFFTNISHEFRTPLTLINWPLKKLQEAENLNPEQLDQLSTVSRNTNRLLQLINQIMDMRKLEKGQSKLNISKIEIVEFITERFINFREEAKSKNIQFTFEKKEKEIIIEADEEKLDKIIYNLLSNAFKYTSENKLIKISLRVNEIVDNSHFSNKLSFGELNNEDFIEISITDTGQGIDRDDLHNIFERFEQGKKEKGKIGSTGIGLNLCKEFTLIHRGVLIVQSSPGKGTCFSVILPTKQKAQKILQGSHKRVKNINSWGSSKAEEKTAITNKKSEKLLVVEDNNDLRKFMVKFLQEYYIILSARDGKEGLSIIKTKNVDLIISDIMMPVMDGLEFCQIIKSQIETSHIPVILLTALSSSENKIVGFNKGADAYISKPFDEKVLFSQIRNLLLQRKRLHNNFSRNFISKQTIDVGNLDNYFLNKLTSIIENNLQNENFTVETLATEMGFHRSQLHRKLKQITNHSTSEYITMVRIKVATKLLTSGKYNIDQVSSETGFGSHSYFTKCFKKIHNQSPKEFVKNLNS